MGYKIEVMDVRKITKEELDEEYGTEGVEVGLCYKTKDNHFYLQREKDVLHINIDIDNDDYIINTNHISFIRRNKRYGDMEIINKSEFNSVLEQTKNLLNI